MTSEHWTVERSPDEALGTQRLVVNRVKRLNTE